MVHWVPEQVGCSNNDARFIVLDALEGNDKANIPGSEGPTLAGMAVAVRSDFFLIVVHHMVCELGKLRLLECNHTTMVFLKSGRIYMRVMRAF